MPDITIVDELREQVNGIEVRFASYGTGAATLRENGYDVIDMELREDTALLDATVVCTQITDHLRPHLIISHEEVGALLAARGLRTRCAYITDFFKDPNALDTKGLEHADEVIFIGNEGVFTEPPRLRNKICYVGPLVRKLAYRRADSARARKELHLPSQGIVISCLPGSWREESGPIAPLVASAFQLLKQEAKQLVWIAGLDFAMLHDAFSARNSILVKKDDWQLDRLMVASNLVITRGSRNTMNELSALGIPSISLSYGLNWPDDVVANRIATNVHLNVQGLTSSTLCRHMNDSLSKRSAVSMNGEWSAGLTGVISRLRYHIETIRSQLVRA
jgi:hypothetical protein